MRCAYTLVELLAVIVVMALAAGFIVPGLAAADNAARCKSIAAQIGNLDRTARLFARSGGAIELAYSGVDHALVLASSESGNRFKTLLLEPGTTIVVRTDSGTLPIVFERTGRSENYEIEVHRRDWRTVFRVTGATSLMIEVSR